MDFTELQHHCFELAVASGWWKDDLPMTPKIAAVKIALIHSEVSEALEGIRKDKQDDHLPHRKAVEVEFADTIIRIFDLASALELDLEGALLEKLKYNQQRQDHKLSHREGPGGKRF